MKCIGPHPEGPCPATRGELCNGHRMQLARGAATLRPLRLPHGKLAEETDAFKITIPRDLRAALEAKGPTVQEALRAVLNEWAAANLGLCGFEPGARCEKCTQVRPCADKLERIER